MISIIVLIAAIVVGLLSLIGGATFMIPIMIKKLSEIENQNESGIDINSSLETDNNHIKHLEEKIVEVITELKELRKEFKQNNERLELLEQNYNFAENLLDDNKDEEKPKSFPENY